MWRFAAAFSVMSRRSAAGEYLGDYLGHESSLK